MKWVLRLFAFIGFITVLLVAGSIYLSTKLVGPKKMLHLPDQVVLTYNLQGNLAEDLTEHQFIPSFRSREFTLHRLIKTLDHATQDTHVKGIVIRLDYASLGIAKIQELQAAIRRFRSTGKFAIAHADTFGEILNGTTTYYLASAFDEIALQPIGSLNLLGLSIELPFARKLLNEIGAEPRFDRREEYKSVMETYTHAEITPENRASLQGLLDNLLSQMIRDISKEREIEPAEIRRAIDGAPYYRAEEAHTLGLIDHIFYWDQCEKYAVHKAGEDAKLMELSLYQQTIVPEHNTSVPAIALIGGSGTIMRVPHYKDFPFMHHEGMSPEALEEAFEEALKDKVKGIVFRIDSPGGSPVASETIRRYVEKAKSQGIPVVVSMGEYAASGGYWIASSASKIIAQPGTITGSIGVAGGKMVFSRLWDKIGISWGGVKAGNNADMSSFNVDFSPEQWQKHQEWLDYIYDSFLHRVAEGRKLSPEQVRQIAKGHVWTGEQALEKGLIDELGGLQEAIQIACKEAGLTPEQAKHVQAYPRKKSFLEKIQHLMDYQALPGMLSSIMKVSQQIQNLLAAFQGATHQQALEIQPAIRVN